MKKQTGWCKTYFDKRAVSVAKNKKKTGEYTKRSFKLGST